MIRPPREGGEPWTRASTAAAASAAERERRVGKEPARASAGPRWFRDLGEPSSRRRGQLRSGSRSSRSRMPRPSTAAAAADPVSQTPRITIVPVIRSTRPGNQGLPEERMTCTAVIPAHRQKERTPRDRRGDRSNAAFVCCCERSGGSAGARVAGGAGAGWFCPEGGDSESAAGCPPASTVGQTDRFVPWCPAPTRRGEPRLATRRRSPRCGRNRGTGRASAASRRPGGWR